MKPFYKVILLFLVCFPCYATNIENNFNGFWNSFRKAVLSNDYHSILLLTKFPFKIKSTLDNDEVKIVTQKGFAPIYQRLLAENTGLTVKPQIMLKFIEQNPVVVETWINSDEAVVGVFRFSKVSGHWYFVSGYLED